MLKHRIARLALGIAAFAGLSAGTAQALIINQNTVWPAWSIHTLAEKIQIAAGVTLTIAPGAIVYGNGNTIEVAGKLNVGRANFSTVTLRDLTINYVIDQGSPNSAAQVNIDNSDWIGGRLLTGSSGHGSFNLKNSYIKNLTELIYVWYPTSPVTISNNLFEKVPTIDDGGSLTLINNTFVGNPFNSYFDSALMIFNNGGSVRVTGNNFINSTAPALETPAGYTNTAFTASQNWFGSSIAAVVANRILDYSDDLTR